MTAFTGMIELKGKNVYAVDVLNTPAGSLWLGKNNGSSEETTAIYILKQ
jgi:hypothetical protein